LTKSLARSLARSLGGGLLGGGLDQRGWLGVWDVDEGGVGLEAPLDDGSNCGIERISKIVLGTGFLTIWV
jgi:hypothetical protein